MKKQNVFQNRKIGKRILCGALAFMLFIGNAKVSAQAEEYWPDAGAVPSGCATVIEVDTGTILYSQNGDEVGYPASITKVLTALLAIENCEMDEIITFSDAAVDNNEGDTSHIFRDYGEQMTVEQCLYAALLFSANECAYALGEHVGEKLGGDYQTFIDLMNKRASDLGCTHTHFANANGLPDENHYTTTHDMALIAADAYKNETFRIIDGTRTYRIPPTNKHEEETPLYNQHLMYYPSSSAKYIYEYCTGGKTGFTDAAGNTLVTYAEKDGMRLACVVMKSSRPQHYVDTINLMDFCFNNFQIVNIADNEKSITQESLKNTGILNNNETFTSIDRNALIVIPATATFDEVKSKIETKDVKKGAIAEINYTYASHEVGAAEIMAKLSTIPENVFQKPVDQEAEDNDEVRTVKVKIWWIVAVVFAVALVAVAIFFGKKLIDNFYWIRHNMEVKKKRKERFRAKHEKKKRRRKKDRLFH